MRDASALSASTARSSAPAAAVFSLPWAVPFCGDSRALSRSCNTGGQRLRIIVPDSGTDQLTGLAGKMTIIIADGKHSYEFEYTLEAN